MNYSHYYLLFGAGGLTVAFQLARQQMFPATNTPPQSTVDLPIVNCITEEGGTPEGHSQFPSNPFRDAKRILPNMTSRDILRAVESTSILKDYAAVRETYDEAMAWARGLDPVASGEVLRDFVIDGKNNGLRLEIALALLANWAKAQPLEAADWAEKQSLSSNRKQQILLSVVPSLFSKDRDAAIKYVQGLPFGAGQDVGYLGLIEAWIRLDWHGALEFSDSLPDDGLRTKGQELFAQRLAALDLDACKQLFADRAEGVFKNLLAGAIGARLVEDKPDDAFTFAQTLDPTLQRSVLEQASEIWMAREPDACMARLVSMEVGEARSDLLYKGATQWSLDDPVAASEWFSTFRTESNLPPENELETGYTIAKNLFRFEPDEAAKWLRQLEDGPVTDMLVRRVIRFKQVDPEQAFDFALKIQDKDLRFEALQNTLKTISKIDRYRAESILNSTAEFTDRDKQRIAQGAGLQKILDQSKP